MIRPRDLRQRIADVAYREALEAFAAARDALYRVPFDALVREDPTAIRFHRERDFELLVAGALVDAARLRLIALSPASLDVWRKARRSL